MITLSTAKGVGGKHSHEEIVMRYVAMALAVALLIGCSDSNQPEGNPTATGGTKSESKTSAPEPVVTEVTNKWTPRAEPMKHEDVVFAVAFSQLKWRHYAPRRSPRCPPSRHRPASAKRR